MSSEGPQRPVSSNRPGGAEARSPSFDGTEQTGASIPDNSRPLGAIILTGVVCLIILVLLVVLLLVR